MSAIPWEFVMYGLMGGFKAANGRLAYKTRPMGGHAL